MVGHIEGLMDNNLIKIGEQLKAYRKLNKLHQSDIPTLGALGPAALAAGLIGV